MRCPVCLELMFNKDEIHRISTTKSRMNLHCNNYANCPSRQIKPYYGSYMQVITNDPNPWECNNYGLIVMRGSLRVLLQGSMDYGTSAKVVENGFSWKAVKSVPFVKLSTGDDMHEQAIYWANKLTKLIAFV